jgi:hypothetical protein
MTGSPPPFEERHREPTIQFRTPTDACASGVIPEHWPEPRDDAGMPQRCEACGAALDGRRDRRYCSDRCRQRGYRMRVTARHAEPWQAAAYRLARDVPERWMLPAVRVVDRDVELDDELRWDAT